MRHDLLHTYLRNTYWMETSFRLSNGSLHPVLQNVVQVLGWVLSECVRVFSVTVSQQMTSSSLSFKKSPVPTIEQKIEKLLEVRADVPYRKRVNFSAFEFKDL